MAPDGAGELGTDLAEAEGLVAEAETRLAAGSFGSVATAARRALSILDAGELLEDEPYATWAQGPRRRAARLQRRARSCAWAASLELGDTASALDAATAAVDADPFDEEAHRALMRANHRRGDRGAALVVFKRLERELHDELGVAPADETMELYEAIAGGRPEPERGAGGRGGRSRFRRQSPLVGRRQELYLLREAWAGALAGRCEFVFVAGGAGSGKSRLVDEFRWRAELRLVEVASRLEPDRAELLLDLARQRGSAKYQALALARLGHREEAAAVAAPTGSALLLAEVAPERQARDAVNALSNSLPRDMRSRFATHGRLAAPLR